jgi:hypothetical protein
MDFLSNGFKIEVIIPTNASGGTYIYMAFAEQSFCNFYWNTNTC